VSTDSLVWWTPPTIGHDIVTKTRRAAANLEGRRPADEQYITDGFYLWCIWAVPAYGELRFGGSPAQALSTSACFSNLQPGPGFAGLQLPPGHPIVFMYLFQQPTTGPRVCRVAAPTGPPYCFYSSLTCTSRSVVIVLLRLRPYALINTLAHTRRRPVQRTGRDGVSSTQQKTYQREASPF
jgi:hypothetical protein